MIVQTQIGSKSYSANLNDGIDISIGVGKENEVKAYGIPESKITVYIDGGFVGDVSKGGSCNVRNIQFNPHGNGTHTECVGHVSNPYVKISDIHIPSHLTARLITIKTKKCIKRSDLIHLESIPSTDALIIRTLPNSDEKLSKNYTGTSAPYISLEAMSLIVELGVEHLIVDLPSVDHETDSALKSHKIFWEINKGATSTKTITELVYIPNEIEDGLYLVNLMLPNMCCDAVPSKPILYPLR